jgi:hypothetical protein
MTRGDLQYPQPQHRERLTHLTHASFRGGLRTLDPPHVREKRSKRSKKCGKGTKLQEHATRSFNSVFFCLSFLPPSSAPGPNSIIIVRGLRSSPHPHSSRLHNRCRFLQRGRCCPGPSSDRLTPVDCLRAAEASGRTSRGWCQPDRIEPAASHATSVAVVRRVSPKGFQPVRPILGNTVGSPADPCYIAGAVL